MFSKDRKSFLTRFILVLILLNGMSGAGNVQAAPPGVDNTVLVTVQDTGGAPMMSLNVYAFNGSTYTGIHGTTAQNGQISLQLTEGSYRFRADLNGTQFWSGTANHCDIPGCDNVSIVVSKPVAIIVLDTDGAPKAGLSVYAFSDSTYTGYNKTTNVDGQAVFTLPLGSYRFRADLNGTQFWSGAANHCDIPGCDSASVTVSNPMAVTVLDTDSTPKVGLNVYAFNGSTYTGYNKVTNADGQVLFTLPLGSYRFRADLNGTQFWSGSANHCDIPGCDSIGVTVSKPMTVTVLDTDGAPKAGLNVYAFNGSTYTGYNKTTNVDGQVVFTLPLGNYRFRADLNGTQFWSGAANHCTVPGCEGAQVTVTLPMTVIVQDGGGVSKSGVNVYAFNGSTYTGYNKVSDANGQVIFTLPVGNYRFRADYSGAQYWSGSTNHCAVPGCLSISLTVGPAMTATPIATYTPTPTITPTFTPTYTATFTPLPTTRMVTNTDPSGPGSLVQTMNESNSGDRITFAPALAGRTITLASSVAVNGKKLILDGSGLSPQVTIDGGSTSGFYLNGPSSLDIYDLTISNFSSTFYFRRDATIRNSTLKGFRNDVLFTYGSLTILNSAFEDNSGRAITAYGPVTITGSALRNNAREAIYATAYPVTITNSILSGNGSDAIRAGALLTVIDSTITGNSGVGIMAVPGSVSIRGTTIYQNTGEAILINGADVLIVNSTLTQNQGERELLINGTGDVDIYNSTIVSTANNVYFINGGASLDIYNSILVCAQETECFESNGGVVQQVNSILGINGTWGLGELANNGGPTLTMALSPGNSLIDAGNDTICTNTPVDNLDQRGVTRPQGAHCDIGAYEYNGSIIPRIPTITTLTTSPNPSRLGQPVTATVTVHPIESESPTGTVEVSRAGNVICTITLVNGTGTCNLIFSAAGTIPITASYNGDSEYLPSSATSAHEILESTPTPSITPSPTLTYTPTVTPTITSTPVVGCSNIAVPAGQTIVLSGKTMYLNINNPMSYDVIIRDVFVRWNYLQGHIPGDSTLRLLSAQLNSTRGTNVFWTGDIHAPNYAISPSTPVVIPAGETSRIVFTFDKTYTRSNSEQIQITFSTSGCETHSINVVRP